MSWDPQYAALTRLALEHRLRVAEDALVMAGWAPARDSTHDRSAAALELWLRWADLVGQDYLTPTAHPDLAGRERALAEQRRATRAETLARFFEQVLP